MRKGLFRDFEPARSFPHEPIRSAVIYEDNTTSDLNSTNYRISAYPLSNFEAWSNYLETGNIGISDEQQQKMQSDINRFQEEKRRKSDANHLFYLSLPPELRMSNKQLREADALMNKTNSSLTEKEKALIQRAENYKNYKSSREAFDQKND
jgi:hypothetical protein